MCHQRATRAVWTTARDCNSNCQQQQQCGTDWLLWRGSHMRYWGSNIENRIQWHRDILTYAAQEGWRLLLSFLWVNTAGLWRKSWEGYLQMEGVLYSVKGWLFAWSIILMSRISLHRLHTLILSGFYIQGRTDHNFSKTMIFYHV